MTETPSVFAPAAGPGQPPAPGRVIDLACGFMVSKALFVAVDAGLFSAAGPDGATVEELAARCQLPSRSVRALADLLASAGLLERNGEHYRNAPDAEAFLAGRGPLDMRPLLRYWDQVSYPTWVDAATAVRTRRGVRPVLDTAQTEAYESAVALVTTVTAAELAGEYAFGRHRRVLDVGGGLGTFLRPILATHRHLTATLVDLPEVVTLAGAVTSGDLAGRVELVGADLFVDPLPADHDALVVANLIHLLPPERNVELLRRLREVVAPDGRLLLVDWWRDTGASHPSARYGPLEFLMISGGDTYLPEEVAQWLAATGWRLVDHVPLAPPASVIVAEPATG